jgi:hypothetical protein
VEAHPTVQATAVAISSTERKFALAAITQTRAD